MPLLVIECWYFPSCLCFAVSNMIECRFGIEELLNSLQNEITRLNVIPIYATWAIIWRKVQLIKVSRSSLRLHRPSVYPRH